LRGDAATSRAVQSQEVAVDWQEPMVRERKAAATTHHRPNQPHHAFTPYAFTRWRRPCEEANIQLQLTTQFIDLESMKG